MASKFKRRWIVSYDNVSQIRDTYQMVRHMTYGLNYTAQTRYVGSEIMFFSNKLLIPDGVEQNTAAA